MGALNLNSFGPGVYGAVQGADAADEMAMRKQGFAQDQAIRAEGLKQSQAQAPLRQQALELGIKSESEEAPLRRKILELNADQQAAANATLQKALKNRQSLHVALGTSMQTKDPNYLAKWAATQYGGDVKPEDVSADYDPTKDEIAVKLKGELKHTYKGGKNASTGQAETAFDAMGKDALAKLDPVKHFELQLAEETKTRDKNLELEAINRGRLAVAEAQAGPRGERADAATIDRRVARLPTVLDKMMKGESPLGALISGYNNADDQHLRGIIGVEAERNIEAGMRENEAANKAAESVRAAFGKAQETASTLADAVWAEGVDPRDPAKVAAAATAGNANALKLQKYLAAVKRELGTGVTQHLQRQLTKKAAPKK